MRARSIGMMADMAGKGCRPSWSTLGTRYYLPQTLSKAMMTEVRASPGITGETRLCQFVLRNSTHIDQSKPANCWNAVSRYVRYCLSSCATFKKTSTSYCTGKPLTLFSNSFSSQSTLESNFIGRLAFLWHGSPSFSNPPCPNSIRKDANV